MSRRSTVEIYQNVLQGSGLILDATPYAWPSFKRQELAEGGQHAASFSFSAADSVLESWLSYLGAHVVETDAGEPVFEGLIYTLRLRYHGVAYVLTLADMHNSVTVSYSTTGGGAKNDTTTVTSAASIALYGTKELRVELTDPVSATAAAAYADALLAELAFPRVRLENVASAPASSAGTLSVDVRGYLHTLDWRHYNNALGGDIDLDQAITDALASADYVTSTNVASNTLQVARTSDQRPVWARIKALAAMSDASGNFYSYGVRGRTFHYQTLARTAIGYEMAIKGNARHVYDPSTNAIVRPAQVRAGRMLYVTDVWPAVPPSATLMDDSRSMLIASVTYSSKGVVLKGAQRSAENNAQHLLADQLTKQLQDSLARNNVGKFPQLSAQGRRKSTKRAKNQ